MKKYSIMTMGCQLNENDSEKISGIVERLGFERTENLEDSDLIIFNTCCVRENAEEKLFGKIGEIKKLKKERGTIIAIGGCMTQEKHVLDKIKQSFNYVDLVFGTHTLNMFEEDLKKVIEEKEKIRDVIDIDGEVIEGLPIKRDSKFKASVSIMYGCNNFCTFCIVPYVRGRERSRTPENIINEVKTLAEEGYKEITLLGQNVNSYNGGENYNFANLLNDVAKVDGIERIRFMSPHPKDFTDDVIEAIKNNKKVSRILHMPLQSGSSEVLKKMNRKYTKEQYLELIDKIKKEIPDVLFSTDIIVGFPGETEEDFKDTLDVVSKVNFEQVFMFIYSRRKGTVADKMENQIPEEIKHERFDRLKALYDSRVSRNNQKYIGKTEKILVEGISKNNDSMLNGRSDSNKTIVFEGKDELIGQMVNVEIEEEHKWYLKGKIIDN